MVRVNFIGFLVTPYSVKVWQLFQLSQVEEDLRCPFIPLWYKWEVELCKIAGYAWIEIYIFMNREIGTAILLSWLYSNDIARWYIHSQNIIMLVHSEVISLRKSKNSRQEIISTGSSIHYLIKIFYPRIEIWFDTDSNDTFIIEILWIYE